MSYLPLFRVFSSEYRVVENVSTGSVIGGRFKTLKLTVANLVALPF